MRELTRRDWLKGTSSLAAAGLAYATSAQAQSVTVKGYTPTKENPIRMSANENPYGVARAAHKAMAGAYDVSHLYGGSGRRELLKLYADMNGVAPENILLAMDQKKCLKLWHLSPNLMVVK